MAGERDGGGKKGSKVGTAALLLGAAGLLMFIVGVKRRYRLDEEREIDLARAREAERRASEDADAEDEEDDDEDGEEDEA
jgi:hypothetical protein